MVPPDPGTGSPVWRDDEGTTDQTSVGEQPRGSVWRPDEGTLTRVRDEPGAQKAATRVWEAAPTAPPSTNGPSPTTDDLPAKSRRKSRERRKPRRAVRVIRVGIAVLVVALVGDLAYSLWRTGSSLEATAARLDQARDKISTGDISGATREIADARDSAEAAASALGRPVISAVGQVPLLDREMGLLDRLAEASFLATEAAGEAVVAADALGVSNDGLSASIYRDGVFQLNEIQAATPAIKRAAEMLTEAERLVESSSRPLVPQLADALDRARNRLSSGAESARDSAQIFEAFPALLGGDRPKTYLLAFQATGEARATGGVIGLMGSLSAVDGRLKLGPVRPYTDLFPGSLSEPVDAPRWFERSYGPQYATRQWQQVNSSPHFPSVSKVLLEMYEKRTGKALDGVIALDPIALRSLMTGMRPLEVPGGDPVSSENAAEVLLHDSYLEFRSERQQNAYLANLVDEFWGRIGNGDFNPVDLARGMSEAVATRHVMIYSTDSDTEAALAETEVAGEYVEDDSNIQMVFHNAYTVSKVDYFLHRKTSTRVELSQQGDATVTTRVRLRNEAPAGPASLLLGPGVRGDEPGLNRMLFNVLAPATAEFETFSVDGEDLPVETYIDQSYPVAWRVVEIPAGKEAIVEVTYRILGAISIEDRIPRFKFTLTPQPLVNPEEYSLLIEAPERLALAERYADVPAVERFEESGILSSTQEYDFVLVQKDG